MSYVRTGVSLFSLMILIFWPYIDNLINRWAVLLAKILSEYWKCRMSSSSSSLEWFLLNVSWYPSLSVCLWMQMKTYRRVIWKNTIFGEERYVKLNGTMARWHGGHHIALHLVLFGFESTELAARALNFFPIMI